MEYYNILDEFLPSEEWRDVIGFEGFYKISNFGRVKRIANQCGSQFRHEQIRKLSLNIDGYSKVRLIHGKKDKTARVHRLVAEAFIENPENKETVNHIDGNKLNNCVNNLEWADRKEQLFHAYKLGLKIPMAGSKNYNSRFSEDDIKKIRAEYVLHSKEHGMRALSKRYGVNDSTIDMIVRGKTYK